MHELEQNLGGDASNFSLSSFYFLSLDSNSEDRRGEEITLQVQSVLNFNNASVLFFNFPMG
jgi:hypothetical protein